MIDRKALWISGLLIFAMIAASFWRLSLLPDWHHMPVVGLNDPHTVSGLYLFIEPAALLFIIAVALVQAWMVCGPAESIQPLRRWSGLLIIASAAMAALIQAFMLARSLGFLLALDRLTFAHTLNAAMGMLLMVLGNALPKMPWLSARFRPFQLDPWQWNRQVRFAGKLLVGLGLFIALVPFLLPQRMVFPAMAGMWVVAATASFWHRAKVKREPSPLP